MVHTSLMVRQGKSKPNVEPEFNTQPSMTEQGALSLKDILAKAKGTPEQGIVNIPVFDDSPDAYTVNMSMDFVERSNLIRDIVQRSQDVSNRIRRKPAASSETKSTSENQKTPDGEGA